MADSTDRSAKSGSVIVSGSKMAYSKTGSGEPSIIFLSGHRTPKSNWNDVIARLPEKGSLLTYDRLDVGDSARSTSPQSGNAIVSDLDSLLRSVDVQPPYILVAHSLGGLYANMYARRYPEKVDGLVMVEAAHPSEATQQSMSNEADSGLVGKLLSVFTPGFKKDPNSEYNNVYATVEELNRASPFPDTFLAVITGGMKMPFVPEASFESHLKWQEDLTSLSPSGYQVVAAKSGHTPQISEPDLVVQAILKAIEYSR